MDDPEIEEWSELESSYTHYFAHCRFLTLILPVLNRALGNCAILSGRELVTTDYIHSECVNCAVRRTFLMISLPRASSYLICHYQSQPGSHSSLRS